VRLSPGLIIFGIGLSFGAAVENWDNGRRFVVPEAPASLVQEDKNRDGVKDIIFRYDDGKEIIFYGSTNNPTGSIRYSPRR